MMRRLFWTGALWAMASLGVWADGGERTLQYYPDGDDFVCVNGENRYTRALYGTHTDWRLETSDRPVFGSYKKGKCRNISFWVVANGQSVALDSTDYCEARYQGGRRSYVLRDKRWGEGELKVAVLALADGEGAIWEMEAEGFKDSVRLRAVVSDIANPKLHRMGDMGVDPKDCFDAAPDAKNRDAYDWPLAGCAYVRFDLEPAQKLRLLAPQEGMKIFDEIDENRRKLVNRVRFTTPDPWINTLGGSLVAAADGVWDGDTWLHGAIGWRMPLAGWRAGYLGDVLGWPDRAVSHFDAYAESQVTDVPATIPHPTMDSTMLYARAEKRWGTQMYSTGYICRNPHRNNQMHHYDMNLNYIDELLWHFQWDADTAYLRKMWPVLERHLAWEKRNFDPDGDGLYDAYCCIWASDGLQYSGGGVTHSSAYNYRGNLLAARIAGILGHDGAPYQAEADKILRAMNEQLWVKGKEHWAEFKDLMGLRRVHEDAALWSIYTPIDCGAGTDEQHRQSARYVSRHLPHIGVRWKESGRSQGMGEEARQALYDQPYQTIATSDWMPYFWSINNVAPAEVMHMALAYFEAGMGEEGFRLLKGNVLDNMYLGRSPGNFGQLSHYDAARGECYRDFGDVVGISARALVQGLFGVYPDALNGRCVIRPGFPASWDHAELHTPYLDLKFRRENGKSIYEVVQRFAQPLRVIVRENHEGGYTEAAGSSEPRQTIVLESGHPVAPVVATVEDDAYVGMDLGTGFGDIRPEACKPVDISKAYNSNIDDIFRNRYLSPRPPYTTLQIPADGWGDWCVPLETPKVEDDGLRKLVKKGILQTGIGIPFRVEAKGHNVAYTSLWDNYPDSLTLPLKGKASHVYLLMAGSTNHMQAHIENGLVRIEYADEMGGNGGKASETMPLVNPYNWWPIEQDYYEDGKAFSSKGHRPYRLHLKTGRVSRTLADDLGVPMRINRTIEDGALTLLDIPVDSTRRLKRLMLRTLSNEVVIGLVAVTLQR